MAASLPMKEEPRIIIHKNEMMELTRIANSWEFTCTFCFRRYASAQALGGHQNAHRSARMEEKRLFIRDPIGYRKRLFLHSLKLEIAARLRMHVSPLKRGPKLKVFDGDEARFRALLKAVLVNLRHPVRATGGERSPAPPPVINAARQAVHASDAGGNGVKLDLDLKL